MNQPPTHSLIFYRELPHQTVLDPLLAILFSPDSAEAANLAPLAIGNLLEVAAHYGFRGDLWKNFLTLQLISSENAYSLSCERGISENDSLYSIAFPDFEWFFTLFHQDLSPLFSHFPQGKDIVNYQSSKNGQHLSPGMSQSIIHFSQLLDSAPDPLTFQKSVTQFYRQQGVGMFALYHAFRVVEKTDSFHIAPIVHTELAQFSDLVGYDFQKEELIKNTDHFVHHRPANNVLLFGESGTGKSTCIKAVLNQYSQKKLRMIEIYKHQFSKLAQIISTVRDRGYSFILYMDDLSFEEYEVEYKYLKAIIEGGLETRPQNVLIYATSNRRHLVREQWSDRQKSEDDLHPNDTIEEKQSLAARFGVTIYFPSPEPKQFRNIVLKLAETYHIHMPEEDLLRAAHQWELRHGGLSGRTARQFITYLQGDLK